MNRWYGLLFIVIVQAFCPAEITAQMAGGNWTKPMFPKTGPWGVVVHTGFRGDALKTLGVQWVRIGCRWRATEGPQPGQYDLEHTEKLVDHYTQRGMRVLLILTLEHVNPLYKDKLDDRPLIFNAIERWASAVAERLKGKGVVYEISNEPEIGTMEGYWKDPAVYAAMARRVARAVRKVDPETHLAALSVAWFDRNYIQKSLEAGLLSDGTIDILSYHGYHRRNMMPESGLAEDVAWLRGQVHRYAAPGEKVIVVDSERGYSIQPFLQPKSWSGWRNRTYSETEQAAYLARHYLESIFLGLEIIVWYKDMRGEGNYSLYYHTDEDPRGLRPMGHVYRNLAHLLPENPKTLRNDRYGVSLVDLPDKFSAPDSTLQVRTFLRKGRDCDELIIAAWNQVEAFEGKILESRKRIGDNYYEAWRAISPHDAVEIPVRFEITGLQGGRVSQIQPCDILAESPDAFMQESIPIETGDRSALSPVMKVGPIPAVLVVTIKKTGPPDDGPVGQ